MTEIDPIIVALFGKLPAAGGAWPAEKREAWLRTMALAFEMIYGPGEREIVVEGYDRNQPPTTSHLPETRDT